MRDTIKKFVPAEWEPTRDAAAKVGCRHPRSLIEALNAINAEVVYIGGRRYNRIDDRAKAIGARIRRRNPPRRDPNLSHQDQA